MIDDPSCSMSIVLEIVIGSVGAMDVSSVFVPADMIAFTKSMDDPSMIGISV